MDRWTSGQPFSEPFPDGDRRWPLWLPALALVAGLVFLAGALGFWLGQRGETSPTRQQTPAATADFGILQEVFQLLKTYYVDPEKVTPELLRQGAIQGMLAALGDPHTTYIDPQSHSLSIDIVTGTFEGIGARVDKDPITGNIVIATTFRGAPAERAGLRPGDVILAVDGQSTTGWTLTEAVRRIRGTKGTPVTLKVQHRDGTIEDITIIRETIVVPTVTWEPAQDDQGKPVPQVAIVRLDQFTQHTVPDLREALEQIKGQGYKAIILDLRHNPGGSLDATIRVADMFLDRGIILQQVERGGQRQVVEARRGGEGVDMPMVVLVGPGSASGAELLASALQDNGRAILIGERTFGKATVNQLHELSDGGALYVTVGRWLTPKGVPIEGVGVEPDIPVDGMTEALAQGRDLAMPIAIQHVRQLLARQ
jgi:carboxyl-terminal processing protease